MESSKDWTSDGVPALDPAAEDLDTPRLGESLAVIQERFDRNGALGVLLIDAVFLSDVERRFGRQARQRVLKTYAVLLREIAEERLDLDDLVMAGEIGRNELLVLLFRENRDSRFYRHELPGFAQALERRVQSAAQHLFYPYLREAPEVISGVAIGLRNPKFDVETQVLTVIDEARHDAWLNARIAARRRRREFAELVLDRQVHSVYEPIVEVRSHTVFGYEALARGPKDTEYYSAGALFAGAERESMVFELDCLCRASGLAGAVDFPSGSKLFLNILPTAIHDPNFREERLIKTLEESGLCPTDVVFEISEQESIESFASFKEVRDDYRNLGFQFALDDTGSGYAGLEALMEIQPEFIKVDRAFVSGVDQDPARQDMLIALLNIAERNGAQVIGEGLDTLEELEMLGQLGIHYGQGWLFGKPTPLRPRE